MNQQIHPSGLRPQLQPPWGHWHETYHICDGCPNVLDDCYPETLTQCSIRPEPQFQKEPLMDTIAILPRVVIDNNGGLTYKLSIRIQGILPYTHLAGEPFTYIYDLQPKDIDKIKEAILSHDRNQRTPPKIKP